MKIYGAGTLHSNKLGVKQATSFLPSALHITDTKVIVNCPANYSGEWNGACVLDGNADVTYTASGDLAISGGNVEAKSEKSNGIYAKEMLKISDGAKVDASGYYPALFGNGGVSIESGSQVEATSTGDAGIFSRGDVSIQNSTVKISEAENYYAVTANGTTTVTGSWVETNENSVNGSITDSVLFNGNSGTVIGNATLLGNTTLDAGKTLVIPEGASLSVGAGNTFTNKGAVTVEGSLSTEGGTLACYSHSGGTATCTAQALCDACRTPYGDPAGDGNDPPDRGHRQRDAAACPASPERRRMSRHGGFQKSKTVNAIAAGKAPAAICLQFPGGLSRLRCGTIHVS